jgi:hypothetical protein
MEDVVIKIVLGLVGSGGLAWLGYSFKHVLVAYIQRNKNREVRLRVGESECVIRGHSSKEEAQIIRQLSRKTSAKLQK